MTPNQHHHPGLGVTVVMSTGPAPTVAPANVQRMDPTVRGASVFRETIQAPALDAPIHSRAPAPQPASYSLPQVISAPTPAPTFPAPASTRALPAPAPVKNLALRAELEALEAEIEERELRAAIEVARAKLGGAP